MTRHAITAGRVTLSRWKAQDHAALGELLADRLLLQSLYPLSLHPPPLAGVLAEWCSAPPCAEDRQFAVWLDIRQLIGCVRLERQHLSYFLGRPHWGQGLGSEAIGLLTAELSGIRPGAQVHARVARDNVASCRVLQRNGFVFSGIVPGPNRLRCVHKYSFRVPGRAEASLRIEERPQSAVDRR